MTCQHCCGAEKVFDDKEAKKQLKRYLKKGPRKTSKLLITGLSENMNGSVSMLDIGGGVGAVHLELMNNGINQVTDVDASPAYLSKAKEAASKKRAENITYIQADYLDVAQDMDKHDLVVLDKVICCYPHLDELLTASLSKSNHLFGLVYPKNSIISKLFLSAGNLFFRLKGNDFRVFMHPNDLVRNKIKELGFERKFYKTLFPWNVEVYAKIK